LEDAETIAAYAGFIPDTGLHRVHSGDGETYFQFVHNKEWRISSSSNVNADSAAARWLHNLSALPPNLCSSAAKIVSSQM
jgi:hypothetical protein